MPNGGRPRQPLPINLACSTSAELGLERVLGTLEEDKPRPPPCKGGGLWGWFAPRSPACFSPPLPGLPPRPPGLDSLPCGPAGPPPPWPGLFVDEDVTAGL